MNEIRTIELIERRPRVCRLARGDLEFLLEHHRSHVEVAFIGRDGRYRLTSRGVAGNIVLPSVRLHIRPKITLANLMFMLDAEHLAAQAASMDEGTELFDVLTKRLVQLMCERISRGLHRGYVERSDSLATLQGRLDVPTLARDAGIRKDRLPCLFDEFTLDVPCNRLVKSTAERVLHTVGLSETVRAAVRQALAPFGDVSPMALNTAAFDAALADPATVGYRPLLEWCRLFAESVAPTFLMDLEHVFERHVTRGIVQAFADPSIRVEVQPTISIPASSPKWPSLSLRPDIVLRSDGEVLAVIDAKWKRFSCAPEADDLHQILAYAAAFGAKRVALVYPGKRFRSREYRVDGTAVTLSLHTVRVDASMARLARRFRAPREESR